MLKMIDLPYPLNALEPYYSKQTGCARTFLWRKDNSKRNINFL